MFGYLLSFHYYRETDLDALAEAAGDGALTFFADSGAFSAKTAGAQISVRDYAAWLKRWRHRLHAYASLDVMHNPRASRANLERLRELDLDPLPVWHVGSSLEELDLILADEADYIAVGGMVRASITKGDPRLWRYLDAVHARAGAAGTRLHGFGLGAWRLIERYPWFSADSSLASMGFRYGVVSAYDMYANTWRQWHLRDRKAWGRWGWLVREYEMTPDEFHGSNVTARAPLITLAARSWSLAAKRLETRIYTTPHLSVSAIKSPSTAPIGQELMRCYEDGNRWSPTVYIADPHPSANKNVERIVRWQEGNRWGAALAGAGGALPAAEGVPAVGGSGAVAAP
jgi:hypothetical protein